MLTRTATLHWTLQDILESEFASTVKSACTRNPSLRGSEGMQESNYTPCLVKSGTTSSLESARLILEGQLTFLPVIPDRETGSPFAHPAPHVAAGVPSHSLSWTSTCFTGSRLWQGQHRTAVLATTAKPLIDSKHLQKCPPTLHGAILHSGGWKALDGDLEEWSLWDHRALTAHWSEPEAVPIISSAFSHLYRSFHVHSLLGYPSWYHTLDVQPWKRALKVSSAHLCISNEGSKIPQSP